MKFKILSQDKNIVIISTGVKIITKDSEIFSKPYWIVDISSDYVLGTYKDLDMAKKVLLEIYNSENGKYEMPRK